MGAENHTLQAGLDGTARLCPKQNETRKNKPIIILPQWAKTCLSCYVQNSEIPTLQNYKTNRKITIPPPPTPAPGRQDGLVLELKALAAKLDHLDLTRNPHGGRKLTPQFSSNLHTHVFHPQIIKWHEKKKKKQSKANWVPKPSLKTMIDSCSALSLKSRDKYSHNTNLNWRSLPLCYKACLVSWVKGIYVWLGKSSAQALYWISTNFQSFISV